jgi:hypothetical protein
LTLSLAVQQQLNRRSVRCNATALGSFEADAEIFCDSEIAKRWLVPAVGGPTHARPSNIVIAEALPTLRKRAIRCASPAANPNRAQNDFLFREPAPLSARRTPNGRNFRSSEPNEIDERF